MSMFYFNCSVCNCEIESINEGICVKGYFLIDGKAVCIDCAKKLPNRCPVCGDYKGFCNHEVKKMTSGEYTVRKLKK